jgi:hypothetical protein
MIFRASARVPQFQQDELRGQDGPRGFGLREGTAMRRVTRVQQRLIEKCVGEDGVHDDLETP